MKKIVPVKMIIGWFAACSMLFVNAQTTSPELIFNNPVIVSGNNGADNSVYRFPSINATQDALLKITGRSSSNVDLNSIDITSTGFGKAFQPRINYSGNLPVGQSYWMEFEITFVNSNTSVPSIVSSFYATVIDIDGDNAGLREWDAFFSPNSYTVETNTLLQTLNSVTGSVLSGKTFLGSLTDYSGIDTTATQLMATVRYNNTNQFRFRLGATEGLSNSGSPNRMYSIWFKNFSYSNPITLPVKLNNFQGSKNKNTVMLQWSVGMNEIAESFSVERSFDGKDFSSVVLLLGSEKSGNEVYNYTDITEAQKVYYRLKMTDKSGVISYSKILVFVSAGITGKPLNIVGNTVSDKLTIGFQSEMSQPVELRIMDMNGRMILNQKLNSQKGNNLISLSLPPAMNSGMYIATLSAENTNSTAKFIKQ